MELKWFRQYTSDFSFDRALRCDAKFYFGVKDFGWNIFHSPKPKLISLKNIFTPDYKIFLYEDGEQYKGIPTGQEYLDQFGFIKSHLPVTNDKHPARLKYSIDNSNIIISSLKGARTPAMHFDFDLSKYVFSNGFYVFKVNDNWNKKFVLWLLRTKILKSFLDNHLYRGIGISTFKEDDFLKIQIPEINIKTQNRIAEKINPLEKEIVKLKKQIADPIEVIDRVFAKEFNYDLSVFESKRKAKTFIASLNDVANDELKFDISLKSKILFDEFIKTCRANGLHFRPIRNNIADVKGGKRLAKGQNVTEEETPYKYVRVDDLSWDGSFDIDNVKYITEENQKPIARYISNKDDILLTIVGATVGKCGLVPEELDGHNITENFARLIVNKALFIPQFLTYCLQSKIVQYQIDEYTGKGSQGKLAIFRIRKLLIPDIALAEQERILNLISGTFERQKEIEKQIDEKQNEINDLIEKTILHKG